VISALGDVGTDDSPIEVSVMDCVAYRSRDVKTYLEDTKYDPHKYIQIVRNRFATAFSCPLRGPGRIIRFTLDLPSFLDLFLAHGFRVVERIPFQ
jgi:hypothetical protein